MGDEKASVRIYKLQDFKLKMKKLTVFMTIVFLAGLIILATLYLGKNSEANLQGQVILNNSGNSTGVTESVLADHNSETDCWVAYQGKVYDITSWLQKHPGGVNAILPYCGTSSQFEEAFTKKHGTTKVALLMKVGIFMGDLKYKGLLSQ